MIAITANSSKNSTPFLKLFLLAVSLSAWVGCVKMPAYTTYPTQKITTGNGPEDMVMDSLTDRTSPRLLVSCSARRKTEQSHHEIWTVDLKTDQAQLLPRKGEPEGIGFKPHGIDIVKRQNGKVTLYVVNHRDDLKRQMILEYEVHKTHLQFVAVHENAAVLTTPNDVCFDPDGGFYWSNDASTRKRTFIEPVFGIKGGFVGHYTQNGNWEKSTYKFGYPNGIIATQTDLYISTVIQDQVLHFKNRDLNSKPEVIAKVPGGDNISFTPDGNLLVTAHLRQIKFLRHFNNSTIKSPSVVYLINPTTKASKVVYANDGTTISAASTAIWYNGYLYICQVFDGFIIKAKTGTL